MKGVDGGWSTLRGVSHNIVLIPLQSWTMCCRFRHIRWRNFRRQVRVLQGQGISWFCSLQTFCRALPDADLDVFTMQLLTTFKEDYPHFALLMNIILPIYRTLLLLRRGSVPKISSRTNLPTISHYKTSQRGCAHRSMRLTGQHFDNYEDAVANLQAIRDRRL